MADSRQQQKLRMDAYYYGFAETGVPEIDRVLSAVACAGKAFHLTEDWLDECEPYPGHTGKSPVEWIQDAADDAAKAFKLRDSTGSAPAREAEHVAWLRYKRVGEVTTIHVCDSDAPGAFKVFREASAVATQGADLRETVARNLLAMWNREREGTGEWPAGQQWDDLSGSSKATLLRHADELLGRAATPEGDGR